MLNEVNKHVPTNIEALRNRVAELERENARLRVLAGYPPEKKIMAFSSHPELEEMSRRINRVGFFESIISEAETRINWTPEMEALYGFSTGEFDGRMQTWASRVHPEDLPNARGNWEDLLNGKNYEAEFRVIWPDNSIHWLMARGKVQFDEQGRPLKLLGINVDITERKQVEEKLRESERRFERLINTNIIGVIISDLEGRILEANEAFLTSVGYSREDLEARRLNLIEMTPPEWSELDLQQLEKLKTTGVVPPFEKEFFRKNGSRVTVLAGAATLEKKMLAYVLDLTDFKAVEEQRQQSEEQFRVLAESIPQLVWITDASGFTTYQNRRFGECTGAPENETMGNGWMDFLHPADREKVAKAWNIAIRSGNIYQVEYRLLNRNTGEYSWYLGRALPLRDSLNRIVRWFGTTTDINDHKRAQERLSLLSETSAILASSLDYRETFQKLVRLMTHYLSDLCMIDLLDSHNQEHFERVAVAHHDPDREVLAKELDYRYPPQRAGSHPLAQVLTGGHPMLIREVQPEHLSRIARDGEHLRLLLLFNPKSVMCVPLVVRGNTVGAITFIANESGQFYNHDDLALAQEIGRQVAVALDNAMLYQEARKALETERELDTLRTLFFSIASHELRTPLTTIKGFAQMALRSLNQNGRENTNKLNNYLENIQQQADRLNGLIAQLADFSRIQNKALNLKLSYDANPVKLLERVLEQQRLVVSSHLLELDLPGYPVRATYDEERLEQVLNNLISNAVKYSPSGTTVRIGIKLEKTALSLQNHLLLWVKDQGYGISQEHQQLIFERFYRIKSEETARVDGMGLGLYICHQIILQHGGQMFVESQPGHGSTFYIRLPLQPLFANASHETRSEFPLL
jgi:PAS domain S-box-containing protein